MGKEQTDVSGRDIGTPITHAADIGTRISGCERAGRLWQWRDRQPGPGHEPLACRHTELVSLTEIGLQPNDSGNVSLGTGNAPP